MSPDQIVTADHIVLAVGTRPARPRGVDFDERRVIDSDGILRLEEAVPRTMTVVGAGVIGVEYASMFAALGSKVTVVELTPLLLPLADRDLVKPLHDRLNKLFAGIYLETKVVSVAEAGDGINVVFEDANGKRTEKFSRVLVSVGRRPNSMGLGLENTEVEIDEKGFVVTGHDLLTHPEAARWPLSRAPYALETSVPGVFAAGDVRLDSMKRVASAVGEGAMSVYLVHRYLATI